MRQDRKSWIVREAVAEMMGTDPAGTAAYPLAPSGARLRAQGGGTANGTATGAVGGVSIQDAAGNLYCMCGVSVCGGDDVVAP